MKRYIIFRFGDSPCLKMREVIAKHKHGEAKFAVSPIFIITSFESMSSLEEIEADIKTTGHKFMLFDMSFGKADLPDFINDRFLSFSNSFNVFGFQISEEETKVSDERFIQALDKRRKNLKKNLKSLLYEEKYEDAANVRDQIKEVKERISRLTNKTKAENE